jgi:uncharacterized protein YukE
VLGHVPLRVIPAELRGVAGGVSETGSQVAEVMASLRAQIIGESAGTACAFTAGDANSFHSHCGQLEQAGGALAGVINDLGDALSRAADVFEESDRGNAPRA